jgi:regulator of sirC expression with transglutaminase-like and TPR domain
MPNPSAMDGPSSVKRGTPSPLASLRFEELARQKDSEIDVALGAALVARDVYPDLDVDAVLAELDRLAAPLFDARLEERSAESQAEVLNEHVYGALGFRGNESDYYDPKNSLLSDVLSRRTGIPLTLAIVYCELARRVGVPARGVGFPGHFIVRIERTGRAAPALVIDPFFGGKALREEELRTRLSRVLGPNAPVEIEPHLAASSPRAILVRMLTNLKAIYLTRGEKARAHLAVDRIASLLPNAAGPLYERGRLAAQLGARESARNDLTRALTLHPDDADERAIQKELRELGGERTSLN